MFTHHVTTEGPITRYTRGENGTLSVINDLGERVLLPANVLFVESYPYSMADGVSDAELRAEGRYGLWSMDTPEAKMVVGCGYRPLMIDGEVWVRKSYFPSALVNNDNAPVAHPEEVASMLIQKGCNPDMY